jgi:hypothetical protein
MDHLDQLKQHALFNAFLFEKDDDVNYLLRYYTFTEQQLLEIINYFKTQNNNLCYEFCFEKVLRHIVMNHTTQSFKEEMIKLFGTNRLVNAHRDILEYLTVVNNLNLMNCYFKYMIMDKYKRQGNDEAIDSYISTIVRLAVKNNAPDILQHYTDDEKTIHNIEDAVARNDLDAVHRLMQYCSSKVDTTFDIMFLQNPKIARCLLSSRRFTKFSFTDYLLELFYRNYRKSFILIYNDYPEVFQNDFRKISESYRLLDDMLQDFYTQFRRLVMKILLRKVKSPDLINLILSMVGRNIPEEFFINKNDMHPEFIQDFKETHFAYHGFGAGGLDRSGCL